MTPVSQGPLTFPQFTAEDIALYKNHEDPLLHPDTDWIGTFLRKFFHRLSTMSMSLVVSIR